MKLLLDERNLIVAIGSDIAYGVWGNVKDMYSWRITSIFVAIKKIPYFCRII